MPPPQMITRRKHNHHLNRESHTTLLWVQYLHAAHRGMRTSTSPVVAASPTTRSWLGILNTAPKIRRTRQ